MSRIALRLCLVAWSVTSFLAVAPHSSAAEKTLQADLLIVGGTESGWAAAMQAARMKVPRIVIVHDGRWLGGQYTEQALVCVDENKGVGKEGWGPDWHPMKRSFPRSGLFKELMDRIEAFNEEKYGSPMPGRPFHGPSTFRPAEAEAIFRQLLQPYVDAGQVVFVPDYYPIAAIKTENRLTGLRFKSLDNGAEDLQVDARITIDASDWGDAIQVAGAAFECGPDPQSRYNEPSAPQDMTHFPPNTMNPITWAMIVEQADEDAPLAKPPLFDDRYFARTSQLSLTAMKQLQWDRPVKLSSIPHWPAAGKESPRQLSIFTVRRIVDGNTSRDGKTSILLNYMLGQDYPLSRLPAHVVAALEATEPGASEKNIVQMTRQQRDIIFQDAQRHSLCLFYHLQNFVHEHAADKTNSFRHFVLSDEFGTENRLPPKPYIREALRLQALYMMREQDGRNTDGKSKNDAREKFAQVMYDDGIMPWQFHYDFHRTGRAYLKAQGNAGPWIDAEQPGRNTSIVSDRSLIPLRSFIPVEVDGLLGAQKNLGYSSIVSAAIRLHDQCVHIGQVSGATAAISLQHDELPREFPYQRQRLEEIRGAICGNTKTAVPLQLWPYRDLSTDDPCFVAVNRLAAGGALPIAQEEIDFMPHKEATTKWRDRVVQQSMAVKDFQPDDVEIPAGQLSRGEFAIAWWKQIADFPAKNVPRISPADADGDSVPDRADPLLLIPGTKTAFAP